jgi:polyhydroxybutyrate depolymerase
MTPGDSPLPVSSSGIERSALVHVPRGIGKGRRVPLVLGFGGAGMTGPAFASFSGLSTVADRFGFIAVYPTATGASPFWNMSGQIPGKPDDVRFVSDVLDTLEQTLCIDVKRVYATGVSNGGGMAARVGCDLSARFAAIAPVAGGYGTLPPCKPDRPVSVLEIHGTADPVVPYGGKGPDHSGRVGDYLEDWAHRDRCAGPRRRAVSADEVRIDWRPCAQGTAVSHVEIIGGPHAWPGSSPAAAGRPTRVSAAIDAYAFFRRHARSRPWPQEER